MSVIRGTAAAGFEAVRAEFERQFAEGQHIGAAVAVYQHGRKVVDLWGGLADEDANRAWDEGTMAVSFSTTKGLTAACLHLLADRGLVQYGEPVAKYWPEFAANGKAGITVYHLLTHQAGLAAIPADLAADDLLDWERVTGALAAETPESAPGAQTAYHAMTFGFLVGEVVRRIDGRSLGTFFRDEIATPLGITELHIGTPDALHPRVATLKPKFELTPEVVQQVSAMSSPGSLTARAMTTARGDMSALLSTPAGLRAEIPAANGVMSARDLARFYACLAGYGELDGVRLLSAARVRAMSELQTSGPDGVIPVPINWALGYMAGGIEGRPQGSRVTAFGHPGIGGSIGYADPEIGLAFGFVLNGLAIDIVGTGRATALASIARACAEAAA
jgi:CubicO group peptidase (beta-lactamase class C family)